MWLNGDIEVKQFTGSLPFSPNPSRPSFRRCRWPTREIDSPTSTTQHLAFGGRLQAADRPRQIPKMQHSGHGEDVGRQSVESESGFLSPDGCEGLSPGISRQTRNTTRGFRFLATLRSIMASWKSEKSAAGLGSGYFPVPNSVEVGSTQDTPLRFPQKGRTKRSRHSYAVMFGLAALALLLGLSAGSYVERRFRGGHDARSVDDIFGNWGKPGTGTENIAWYPTDFMRDVIPVPCHSHNDYWRKVPFFSAIHAGCIGVEADVWLRNQDLLVGHDTAALQPNRTFQSLYVNPIVELLERNNPSTEFYNEKRRGIFDTDPDQTLILLVDLKTGGTETWPWVMRQLEPLRERGWLSYFQDGKVYKRQVTVVGTGNTPFDLIIANSTYRDAFFDAPLDKLENSNYDSTNSYYASASFWSAIGNVWFRGEPSQDQLAKIRAQIREAHARELHARYWELPPWPIHTRNRIWQILVEEGVDLLNVDDLDAATKSDWTKSSFFPGRRDFGR